MYCRSLINSVLLLIVMTVTADVMAQEIVVGQLNKSFVDEGGKKIESISINVGDKISFKNMDPWFHNIFSLSDISTFDLGSYPKGESRSVTFSKAGEAEVECAIHPQMYLAVEVK